jgi:alkylhydroperoxidase family enzyme
MPRIPYLVPEEASAETRELLGRVPELNIFRMMANAQSCLRQTMALGNAILKKQRLSPKLREIAILAVAELDGGRYEWTQHVPIGERVGMSRAQIDALARRDFRNSCFDDAEQAVIAFTEEVVEKTRASEASFAAVARFLSPQEIVELILAIGFYMMMARLTETTDTEENEPLGDQVAGLTPLAKKPA